MFCISLAFHLYMEQPGIITANLQMEDEFEILELDDDTDEQSESLELLEGLRNLEEVVTLYFTILQIGKSWNDALCEQALNKLIETALELDKTQNKVDKARLGTGGSGILSGIAGIVGFALLSTPVTLPAGIIVLAVSAGLGGASTLVELSTNAGNFLNGKSKMKYIQNSFRDWAQIDCEKVADIANDLDKIVNKVAKDKNVKYDVVMLHLMSLFYFWSSFDKECRRLYNDGQKELTEIILDAKDKLCEQSYPLQACYLFYQKTKEAIESATAAVAESDPQDTVRFVTDFLDFTKDASTCASVATNAVKTASTTADTIGDFAGSSGKAFANLGKTGLAFASVGCAFSIIGIGLGGYTVYDAAKNIKANEENSKVDVKKRKSVNGKAKDMRSLASTIDLVRLLASTIRGNPM